MRKVIFFVLLALAAGAAVTAQAQTAMEKELKKSTSGMVSIPAGKFNMGDLTRNSKNKQAHPVRSVSVPAFLLGKHEVTFAQWDACVADGGCKGYRPNDEGWGRGNRPVIGVSRDDAQSFIRWLNHKTGRHYRLPTEAEWEYAARAGSTTKYSWGDNIGRNRANCINQGDDACGDKYEHTAPVGSFQANPWGLYDMHGNVSEWVLDCWYDNYKGAPNDGRKPRNPSGDTPCYSRVMRGGSWDNPAMWLGSAQRSYGSKSVRDRIFGFRLAHDK